MLYFTPGPAELLAAVKIGLTAALDQGICSISHRSTAFRDIFAKAVSGVRQVLDVPISHQIFFLGSATEAMERILENCVRDCSFHLVNGAFSGRFFEISRELKRKALLAEADLGVGFEVDSITVPQSAELICVTQNETSTGVQTSVQAIADLKTRYPNKLLAVDIVSSAPYVKLDFSVVDAAFFSVQKGFGLPSGLGVLIVNQACLDKAQELVDAGLSIGSYHGFLPLLSFAKRNETPETPNVLGMYLLGMACDQLLEMGLDNIRQETEHKAKLLYDFVDASQGYQAFVSKVEQRSKTVLAVNLNGSAQGLHEFLMTKGIQVGSGYARYKENQIRIANFPVHKVTDVTNLIRYLTEFQAR